MILEYGIIALAIVTFFSPPFFSLIEVGVRLRLIRKMLLVRTSEKLPILSICMWGRLPGCAGPISLRPSKVMVDNGLGIVHYTAAIMWTYR